MFVWLIHLWIVFCDIHLSRAAAAAEWTRTDTCSKMILWNIFCYKSHLKWWMAFKSAECKSIFFSVYHFTVHHGSAKKKKRFRVASCKCLMLLHRGAAKSCPAEWGTVYWRYSLISIVFLLLIRPSALVSFVYLFYKNELMPFQIVCTF